MKKHKLIGSAGSLESLNDRINAYFFSQIHLIPVADKPDHWDLYNSKGFMKYHIVVKRKYRYRLEIRKDES